MMRGTGFHKWALAVLVGIGGLVTADRSARAQATGEPEGDIRLEAVKLDSTEQGQLQGLREGHKAVTEADKPLLDKAARWFLYRLTWVEYQSKQYQEGVSLNSDSVSMNSLVQEAYKNILAPDPKKPGIKFNNNQQQFIQEFSKPMLQHIKVVLTKVPIARVNAALILAKMAETGQEEIADACRDVLKDDTQIDAVKFHAAAGLRNIFKTPQFQEDGFRNKDREAACILALIEFLNRKPNLPAGTTPEEVEGYRYVRREAIRALGLCRLPGVVKNNKTVLGRPALDLLRIVRHDGITPPPSLTEQVEAAIGICQMRTKLYPDSKFYAMYQPDYAVYQLGQFVVEFNARFAARDKGKPEAWKMLSARLGNALTTLREDLLTEKYRFAKDKATYVEAFFVPCLSVLNRIETNSAPDPRALRDWLVRHTPKDTVLFSDMPDSAIKTPVEGE
jgi:hypothetical protein